MAAREEKKLIATKSPDSVPFEIAKGINIITKQNADKIIPVGSWIYKSQLYPGDVDLIEIETDSGSRKKVVDNAVKTIQNIVKHILDTRRYYLTDVKSGIDEAFQIFIGKEIFDNDGNWSVIHYSRKRISIDLYRLYKNGIIPEDEYRSLRRLVVPNNEVTRESYEKLSEALRERWVLRWSWKEIKKGYKTFYNNRKIKLSDTVQQKGIMTKIDIVTLVNGVFVEFSNVMSFRRKLPDGRIENLNYYLDPNELDRDLRYEVQKYAFKTPKPFKLAKRMWNLARVRKDFKVLEALTPLLQSELGRLNQINSEVDTVMLLIEKIENPPMTSIIKEINRWAYRLQNISDFDTKHIVKMINEATYLTKSRIHNELDKIHSKLNKIMYDNTMIELNQLGLYPPPPDYLPKE